MRNLSFQRKLCLIISISLIQLNCFADRNHLGFGFENDKQNVTIPFKNVNNLIVLQATLDDEQNLNLILDTGIRSLVLFNKSFIPKISDQTFQIKFTGTGVHTPIPAKVSTRHNLRLSKDVVANQINVVILKKSNTHLHEIGGMEIHGVFGYQLLTRFSVQIDFQHELITLSEPSKGQYEIKGYQLIPLTIHDTKPFVQLDALNHNQKWARLNLILDLGANHKILIHNQPENSSIISTKLKNQRIAEGLNGSIYGYKTNFEKVRIGTIEYTSTEILIPNKNTYHQESLDLKKQGSIGSKFFDDQTIIIDYANGGLYLKNISASEQHQHSNLAQEKHNQPELLPETAN
jgi:hypothetical protein